MSNRIAVLTDSTCDIPGDLRKEHNIYVIPQLLIWGEETLRDMYDIDGDTFYKRLPVDPVHPRTSQPSVGDFKEFYEKIRADGAEEIVGIYLSDELSGTIASATGAQDMVDFPVHIVDSRSVSLGLGAIVMAAVETRDKGGDAAAMIAAARDRATKTRIVFVVDTLEYLHKGGRIGGAQKLVGTALNLKPLLYIDDGRIEPLERIRTRSKALERMLEVALDGLDASAPVGGAVLHANTPQDAAWVAEKYQAMYKPAEFMQSAVTPIIGVHSGPGVVGVASYNL